MKMSIVGNPVSVRVLLILSVVATLTLVMSHATPAQSQQPATVLVSNLGPPVPTKYPSIVHSEIVEYSDIGRGNSFAQSFCTGSVAATLDKVRLHTVSKEADRNTMFYEHDPAPVVTIRSTDPWGKPGAVLHTLTNPVIDGSIDTAEDFTSSGYELAANTTYSLVIHKPRATGHIGFASTFSPFEDTGTQLGWAIGDQYLHEGGLGWSDLGRTDYVMRMAVYSSGDLPSISTPAFVDTDCDGTTGAFEFSVDENAAENTVGGVAAAGDADGDSMTYSVGGTDAATFNSVFNFNTSTGEITVKSGATLDYESSDKSYSITVSVTDGEDATGAAESPATTDATTSVSIEVINIDEPGIVTLSTTAPRVGGELTASLSDPDDDVMIYTVQWSRSATADGMFLDIPLNPRHMADPTYTPTAADRSNYLKVTMFYVEHSCREVARFDDRCRKEAEFTFDTLVANAEGLIVQSQVVNSPATGTVRITGTPRLGWTLRTHGRGLADAEGRRGALYFQWIRVDPVTNVEQNVSNPEVPGVWWSYVVQEADVGKAIKVRVSFRDNAGNAESVTSDAVDGPYPLTATTHDAPASHDGSAAFSFELWFSEAPAVGFATVRDHAFTVTGGSVDNVRRLAPGYNARWEITVTPSSEADVTLALNATTTRCSAEGAICNVDGVKLSGVLELVVPWSSVPLSPATGAPTINGTARVGESLTASTSDIADADGLANASFTYQWLADDVDISGATGSSYTVVTADAGKVIKVTVSFTDDAGNEESVTSAATATVTQPPLTVSTHDLPEFHDGSTAFTFELRFSEEPGSEFSATTLRDEALTVSGGTVTNVRQLDTGKNLRWGMTVQPSGNEEVFVILPPTTDCAAQGAICTSDGGLSVGLAILVLGPQNSAATGAPTINGTAQVGEILTASTTDIADADGLANASFTYQWLADDADIDGAATSSYTLADAEVGKAIKVTVSFTDDAGNEKSVTSSATAAVTQPPMTATIHDEPSSHDGIAAFTFELRFSETPASGFSYTTVRDHAFTVTGGSVEDVRRLEPGKNVKWEITVTPDSDADVTLALNATTDCTAEGAICNADGGKLAGDLELTISGPPPPPPLTASIHSAPQSHDGSNDAFTFELRLSGEPTSELSYTTVHLHALTVTGGTVSKARRLAAPSNARWEITVTPDSSGDVTIVLPITSDCTAQGAICYGDGGKLSNRLELTVSGPGG